MAKPYPTLLMETNLPLPLFIRGKVRDTYDLGNQLLVIATDRISAFDVVLPRGVPAKGMVLNQLSVFWFRQTADLIPNHLLETIDDVHSLDSYIAESSRFAYPDYLPGRAMIVKKVKRLPIECVVRGYLAGAAWTEYRQHGRVANDLLTEGMEESEELPRPIFTPTTKAESGHDEPLDRKSLVTLVGPKTADELEEKSLAIYNYAREYASSRGIIIADTKFEFGIDGERLILIDEILTPDSSRFWDAALYKPGQSQPSFDKQPVRDWLEKSGWNKEPPAPPLPADVVKATTARYIQAYEKITGLKLL